MLRTLERTSGVEADEASDSLEPDAAAPGAGAAPALARTNGGARFAATASLRAPAVASPQPPRVLIVEDDEDSRYVYTLILEANGFEVVTATSGVEGLALARETHPDAILMDVSIPETDGWTVTETLKGDAATRPIPIIVITAHAFPEDHERAEQVGCDAFLTKPCEPRQVLEEVQRVLRQS